MAARWRISVLTVVFALLSATCTESGLDSDLLKRELDDGRTVGELLSEQHEVRTALLIYPAEACLSCSSPLSHWLEAKRNRRIDVLLIVAGRLGEEDRRILRIHRVPVTAYISDSTTLNHVPAEYVWQGGRLRDKAEGYEAVWRRRLWEHVLR